MRDALQTWRERLDFLLREEARAVDSGQKFALTLDIKEAKERIADLQTREQQATKRIAANPGLRVYAGHRIEVFRTDQSAVMTLNWDLPAMDKRFGAVASQHAQEWKRIHTQSELLYAACRLMHIQMILCHERQQGLETVTILLELAVTRFKEFRDLTTGLTDDVAQANHLVALCDAEKGFSALRWIVANARPGTIDFEPAVVFVERLCTWSFETLSRADRILERYFESAR